MKVKELLRKHLFALVLDPEKIQKEVETLIGRGKETHADTSLYSSGKKSD